MIIPGHQPPPPPLMHTPVSMSISGGHAGQSSAGSYGYNGSTSPDGTSSELGHATSITPVPTQSSSDGGGDIKTEDGAEINCVVCGDKSSGKHYGQFTCEGKAKQFSWPLLAGMQIFYKNEAFSILTTSPPDQFSWKKWLQNCRKNYETEKKMLGILWLDSRLEFCCLIAITISFVFGLCSQHKTNSRFSWKKIHRAPWKLPHNCQQ